MVERKTKPKEDEMLIIRQYQELILYVYNLLKKYPNSDKYALGSETKKCLIEAFELLLYAKKQYSKNTRLKYLNEVDIKLTCLKIYIRIAKKNNYINQRNYRAWSYKVTSISNMLGSWINSCLVR
ncbi:MAG: four helix bundle protein [Bacilli bacterium]|jgi:hypothetical protein